MNTAELINKLLDRADGSLDHLKLHYGPLFRYVITPILHDERDREEVFSDILIRVWDRIDQYDPKAAVGRTGCPPSPETQPLIVSEGIHRSVPN